MKVGITFTEISNIIEKKLNAHPTFTKLDDKTLEVSCKPKPYVPTISMKLHIEAVQDDTVSLSYDCNTAVSLMISGAVAYLEEKIPHAIEVNTTEKRVNLHPLQMKELEKVVEYVSVSDIEFDDNYMNITLIMI